MGIAQTISDILSRNLKGFMQSVERDIIKVAQQRIYRIEQRIYSRMLSMALFIASLLFLALAAVFFFSEYLHLTKTLSFLIIGIILMLLGIIIRLSQ